MERNFTKTKLAARRTSTTLRWRWVFLTLSIVLFISLVGFCFYSFEKKTINLTQEGSFFSRIHHWVDEHKQNIHAESQKIKSSLSSNQHYDHGPQIHFEFYDTLPGTKIALSENETKPDTESIKHTQAKTSSLASVVQSKNELADATAQNKKKPGSQLVVSADELEQELSYQLKEKKCLLQLGIFHDYASAQNYSKMLSKAGFKVHIVKIKTGKKQIYRIQQGPFINANRAKSVQKNLQKRGFASLVIKLNQA